MATDKCPCGSGLTYADCCEPYITGAKAAPTAEALMRSRYTAYAVHAIDYIIDTCLEEISGQMNYDVIREWSETSKWLRFEIIPQESADEKTVQFRAYYEQGGYSKVHHEIAKFERKDDRWFYSSGEVIPETVTRVGKKYGRNDPCYCGSGKKWKHCCGRWL